jgi:hypothetical protein
MAIIALVAERTAVEVEEAKRKAFQGRPQVQRPATKTDEPAVADTPAEPETPAPAQQEDEGES